MSELPKPEVKPLSKNELSEIVILLQAGKWSIGVREADRLLYLTHRAAQAAEIAPE